MGWKRDLGYVDLNKNGDSKKKKPAPAINPLLDFWIFFGGVVLPATALAIEATTHVCAQNFFDPLPSAAHTVLWAMVPVANLLAWLSIHRDMSQHYGVTLFANGMAVGIAILYSLMFLPLTPVMAIGILFFGLGLLGLSPLLSLLPLWAGANHVGKLSKLSSSRFHPEQAKNLGHLVILVAVLAVELPSTLTRIAISMTNETETRQKGIDILRTFGSQDVMLRACYERSGRATDILGSLAEAAHPTNVDLVRNLFYKVTGRTFNSFPIPESARATMQHVGFLNDDYMDAQVDDEFDLDPDMAGEMVSGVSRGLAVSNSKMDAKIDADAGVAQLDWFLNFTNKSKYDREVRTRVRLPVGAAVNQASLIVDGKEYECQIMVKNAARAVYQAAVKAKKNPLLVSVCGQDTVLVQCYPVPPSMDVKLHLGVVSPLALDKRQQAVLSLPQFEERNFQVNVAHTLLLSSNHEMKSKWGTSKQDKNGFVLSGKIDGAALATGAGVINLSRDTSKDNGPGYWCNDSFVGSAPRYVQEKLEPAKLVAPKKLSVLVDGSEVMRESIVEISAALAKLPKDIPVSISFVSDTGLKKLCTEMSPSDPKFSAVLQQLSSQQCVGGQLDGDGLLEATAGVTDWATYQKRDKVREGAVLWIHGSQPMADPAVTVIKERSRKWRSNDPFLYDMQLASGPNQYIDGVNNHSIKKVERFGTPKEDLELLFEQWSNPGLLKKFSYERHDSIPTASAHVAGTSVANAEVTDASISVAALDPVALPAAPYACPGDKNTMKQLAQLWAYDRIMRDLRSRKRSRLREALQIAGAYHLVTPISSGILADTVPALDENSRQATVAPRAMFDRTYFPEPAGNANSEKDRLAAKRVPDLMAGSTQAPNRQAPESSDAAPSPVPSPLAVASQRSGRPTPTAAPHASLVEDLKMKQSPSFNKFSARKATQESSGDSFAADKPSSSFPVMTSASGGAGNAPALEGTTNGTIAPAGSIAPVDKLALPEAKKEVADDELIDHISQARRSDGTIERFERGSLKVEEEEVSDVDATMDEISGFSSDAVPATAPQKNNANPFGVDLFKPAPMVPESDNIWLSLAAGFLLALAILKKRFSRKTT